MQHDKTQQLSETVRNKIYLRLETENQGGGGIKMYHAAWPQSHMAFAKQHHKKSRH